MPIKNLPPEYITCYELYEGRVYWYMRHNNIRNASFWQKYARTLNVNPTYNRSPRTKLTTRQLSLEMKGKWILEDVRVSNIDCDVTAREKNLMSNTSKNGEDLLRRPWVNWVSAQGKYFWFILTFQGHIAFMLSSVSQSARYVKYRPRAIFSESVCVLCEICHLKLKNVGNVFFFICLSNILSQE